MDFGFINEYVIKYMEFIQTRDFLNKEEHGEYHHIFPTSIFGKNDITIRLSYKDHFVAHWLLAKVYEEEGLKRPYMQMAKAFFSFVGKNDHIREMIKNYTDSDIKEIGILIEEAKEHNRLSSIGEMNPFYGKHHSPETIQRILDTKKKNNSFLLSEDTKQLIINTRQNRDPNRIPKHCFTNTVTNQNYQLTTYDILEGRIPKNTIPGRFYSDNDRLLKSLKTLEFYSTYSDYHWKQGEEHACYGTRHIYNKETDEHKRIKKELPLPIGFIYSVNMSDEHKQKIIEANNKTRGQLKPWVADKVNRNPEKIRKTADKHRGMKRKEETCEKIRVKALNRAQTHGVYITDKTKLYNTITHKIEYFDDVTKEEKLKQPTIYKDTTVYSVIDDNGNKIWWSVDDVLPENYIKYVRKSPVKYTRKPKIPIN